LVLSSQGGVIIGSLKASTENLGDYIQILACLRLLEKLDLRPELYLDRDTELASAPALSSCPGRLLLPLNGWFKRTSGPIRSGRRTSELFRSSSPFTSGRISARRCSSRRRSIT
jgi:hypothetical protein